MTIDRMGEYLQSRGFFVEIYKEPLSCDIMFSITKDCVKVTDYYRIPERLDGIRPIVIEERQKIFLEGLMFKWEECSNNMLHHEFTEGVCLSKIKNVIFNDPATIVFWEDGTKTVVKAQDEEFDPEKGLAMAISKKALGNKGNYCNEIKKWTEPYFEEWREIEAFLEMFRFKKPDRVQQAYDALKEVQNKQKTTKGGLFVAIDEAIGYLGEALDD